MIASRSATACILAALCQVFLAVFTGCRPPPPVHESSSRSTLAGPSPADVDPKTFLKEVFNRYQSTAYYHDDGHVVLNGPGKDNGFATGIDPSRTFVSQTETAPLRVFLNPRELSVDAYTARIRVLSRPSDRSDAAAESIDLTAWFDEPESSYFDGQVLRQQWQASPSERLRLERILADEVLRSRLSAGLAGPPPQLEWLLADRPMSKLFEPQSQFEWLTPATLSAVGTSTTSARDSAGAVSFQRIAVTSAAERFVFWIEPLTSLIRRVELPVPQVIATSTRTDWRQWSLRLELDGATFQLPQTDENRFDRQPSFAPKRVRNLVPLPPSPPSPILGKRIELANLERAIPKTARIKLDSLDTILISLPPADADAIPEWVQMWQQAMPALASSGQAPTHVFVITSDRLATESLRSLPSSLVTPLDPRRVTDLTRQMRSAEGSLGLLSKRSASDRFGFVLLSETVTTPATLAAAVAIIRDHNAGVDVTRRIRSDYETLVQDYEDRLAEQSVR